MVECPRCHKDLPDDSVYCMYCGRSLTDGELLESEDAANSRLKENPRKNQLGKYAVLLLILIVAIFDFGLGTAFSAFGWNVKIPYIISTILYAVCIALAGFGLYVDHVDMKNGYEPSKDTGLAVAAIVFSILITMINMSNVILK